MLHVKWETVYNRCSSTKLDCKSNIRFNNVGCTARFKLGFYFVSTALINNIHRNATVFQYLVFEDYII